MLAGSQCNIPNMPPIASTGVVVCLDSALRTSAKVSRRDAPVAERSAIWSARATIATTVAFTDRETDPVWTDCALLHTTCETDGTLARCCCCCCC